MFPDFKYVVFGTVVFFLMGAAAGWIIGSLAGIYLDHFQFAGLQGIEATRYFGGILVGISGALIGANIGKHHARRKRK